MNGNLVRAGLKKKRRKEREEKVKLKDGNNEARRVKWSGKKER